VIGEFAASTEALLSKYLAEKANSVAFIEVLLTRYYKPGMDFIRVSSYGAGKLEKSFKYGHRWGFLLHFSTTRKFSLYALTLLYLVISLLRVGVKFDTCVACNVPFPLVGLMLRRLRLIRKVIFISVVHPHQSRLFRFVDKIALNSCDAIWYQTIRMEKIKEEEGFIKNHNIPKILVPIGVGSEGVGDAVASQIDWRSIGYVGRLDNDIGLELVIEAFSQVIKKVPNAKLKIIGSGPTEEELKLKVKRLGLEEKVEFLGFIGDRRRTKDILSRCALCVAPYIPEKAYSMHYADSAKAKEYIEYGTPIIITKVPEIAFEIGEKKAGFAVNYDKNEIAEAMIRLLTDDKLRQECRENIKQLTLKYDYKKIYNEALWGSGIKL